ncbi:hypothetical protein Tco_1077322 [Tanacetum coccineum]
MQQKKEREGKFEDNRFTKSITEGITRRIDYSLIRLKNQRCRVLYKVEDIATCLIEYVKFWDDWEVDRYGNANLDYYSKDQYAVSIKEDTAYPCLHSPKTTKERRSIRRIQKKSIRRIEDIVCEYSERYQTWSLLQETLIRRRAKSDLLLNNIGEVFNGKIVRGKEEPLHFNLAKTLNTIRWQQCPKAQLMHLRKHNIQNAAPGQMVLGGSGVGAVIGLSTAAGEGVQGGTGVASQVHPNRRWKKYHEVKHKEAEEEKLVYVYNTSRGSSPGGAE